MKTTFQTFGTASALFYKSRKRLKYAIYFFLSFTLIMLGRVDHPWISSINNTIAFVVTPAIVTFEAVVDGTYNAISWIQGLAALETENANLRQENSRLQQYRFIAERAVMENQRLQELLNVRPTFVPTLVTARVIAVSGGAYSKSVLIHAGAEDGLRVDLPVVDENGLVGRTIQVGFRATRVLLITDFNSRIPVQVERSKHNAIIVGRNDDLLRMAFTGPDMDVSVEDRILTTGHGGMFPADVIVGTVVEVDEEEILIRPAANLDNLDFVRVLDYNANQLEPGEGN